MFSSAALKAITRVNAASDDATGVVIAMIDSICDDMFLLDGMPSQLRIQLLTGMFEESDEDLLAEAKSQLHMVLHPPRRERRARMGHDGLETGNQLSQKKKAIGGGGTSHPGVLQRSRQLRKPSQSQEKQLVPQNFAICSEFPSQFLKSLCG
jgi:hypothetical protein